jgi:hypothetical protein
MIRVIAHPKSPIPQAPALALVDVRALFIALGLRSTVNILIERGQCCLVRCQRVRNVWQRLVGQGA